MTGDRNWQELSHLTRCFVVVGNYVCKNVNCVLQIIEGYIDNNLNLHSLLSY